MKTIAAVLVLLVGAGLAFGQEVPRAEIFAGYSYMNVNPSGATRSINTSGWEAELNYNLNKTWGIVGDISGHYCCSGQSIHNFMVGPQLSYRLEKHTFFVHGLVGGSHASGLSQTDTNVAWAGGGGWDWNVRPSWAIRVFQADYLGTHFLSQTQANFRVSTGIVFRWGKR